MRNSTLEKTHRCQHVIRKKIKRGRVYETYCERTGAMPMFTRAVTSKTRVRRQPRWFCNIHWPKHVEVRFDGAEANQQEFPGTLRHKR
jgi:hypothetical protein